MDGRDLLCVPDSHGCLVLSSGRIQARWEEEETGFRWRRGSEPIKWQAAEGEGLAQSYAGIRYHEWRLAE